MRVVVGAEPSKDIFIVRQGEEGTIYVETFDWIHRWDTRRLGLGAQLEVSV